MAAHLRDRVDERFCLMVQTAARLRRRAWQGYLEATRDASTYRQVEPEAWARLQARLADIDDELEQALSTSSAELSA